MAAGDTFQVDGSLDFSGGVNSLAVTTVASPRNPNGLMRNELAWLVNGTVRDGGISPRNGYTFLGTLYDPSGLFQGAATYQPDNANPLLMVCISGQTFLIDPDNVPGMQNLTNSYPATALPPNLPYFYFCQAEQFMVIQAGDYATLPLFFDGTKLSRSVGITNPNFTPSLSGENGINEIPPAGPMDYFMQRLWYAQGRTYSAGDIVKNLGSGTAVYNYRDSVLQITENPLAIGGDGFTVPDNAGNIRALDHSIALQVSPPDGQLFASSREAIYAQSVPITRTQWVATTNNAQAQQTIAQISDGPVNDRSVVAINGDLYYQTLEPGIASLALATRYFTQPGNIELSAAEDRILNFVNRGLLPFATGCYFDNRLLESSLPAQLPQGVAHAAIIPLDFLPISTFGSNFQPVWEGHHEGVQVLQMLTGDFGGLRRQFMITVAAADSPAGPAGSIQLYETVQNSTFDYNAQTSAANPTGESRINWQMEFPAFTWGDEFALKKMVGGELWVDRIAGEVLFLMEWRPDGETCWQTWHEWSVCSARNSCEDVVNPVCYPLTPYGQGYRQTMGLPLPPQTCESQSGRPSNVGFQMQCRLTIKGACRVRGIQLFAEPVQRGMYQMMVCLAKKWYKGLMRFIG